MKKVYSLFSFGLILMLLFGYTNVSGQSVTMSSSPAQCFGDNDGAINIIVSGATISSVQISPNTGTITIGPLGQTADVSDLLAGSYTVTVNYNGGGSFTDVVDVSQPDDLFFSLDYTWDCANTMITEFCAFDLYGGNSQFGGTPPYDFYWLDATNQQVDTFAGVYSLPCITGSTTPLLMPIDMTTYQGDVELYVFDSKDCFYSATDTLLEPDISFNITVTPGVCVPANSGSLAVVNVSGGVPPYLYIWSTGDTSSVNTLSNLLPGTYDVTVYDTYGCASGSMQAVIPNPNQLAINSVVAEPSCFGLSDGSITATVTGNSSPTLFYQWLLPSPNPPVVGFDIVTLDNVAAGSYAVTISDPTTQCTINEAYVVAEPSVVTSAMISVSPVSCSGACDGVVIGEGNGGTPPYTYSLYDNGNSTQTTFQSNAQFSGVCAGSYAIIVHDANNCEATSASFDVTEPSAISLSTNLSQVSCYNGTDGQIILGVGGGSTPYTYNWTLNGASYAGNNVLDNLGSGEYCVTVTDANGCEASTCASLVDPPLFTVSLDYVTHNLCYGDHDGTIGVTVNGGSPGYIYSWTKNGATTGLTTEDINNLGAGEYCLTVTDNNGCIATLCTTVNQPPPLTILGQVEQVSCNSSCDGFVRAISQGGTPGYTYTLNDAFGSPIVTQIDTNFNNLCAGIYSLLVEDANGCISEYPQFPIAEPSVLSLAFVDGADVTCYGANDGFVHLVTQGGTTPYSFEWNNGATTEDLDNLGPGTYTLTVTDANNCIVNFQYTIIEPPLLSIDPTFQGITCNGACDGYVTGGTIGGTTPYTYQLETIGVGVSAWVADPMFANLCAGTYIISVKDANGCVDSSLPIEILDPPLLVVSIPSYSDVTCNSNSDGSIQLSVSGGTTPYIYSWEMDQTVFTSYNDPSNLSGLAPGDYCVTVTDANNCSASVCQTITEPTSLTLDIVSTDITCCGANNGTISLTINGGTAPYTVLWNGTPGGNNLDNLSPGTYNASVTDANGCIAQASAVIYEPDCLIGSLSAVNISCNGADDGMINFSFTGGTSPYTVEWEVDGTLFAGDPTAGGLAPGNYCVTVTDANLCTWTDCVQITQPEVLFASAIQTDITCCGANDGTATLTITGGTSPYMITWDGVTGSEVATNLTPGQHTAVITDMNQCQTSVVVDIVEPSCLTGSLVATDITCFGANDGSLSLSYSGGTSPYTLSDWTMDGTVYTTADPTLVPLMAGEYCVTISDANGCQLALCATVTEPAPFTLSSTKQDILCYGLPYDGEINVTTNGGVGQITYTWTVDGNAAPQFDGMTSLTNLAPGEYCLTAVDASGCTASTCQTILEPPVFEVVGTTQDVSCNGGFDGQISISINGGVSPYNIYFSGILTNDMIFTGLGAAVYTINVYDLNGCTVSNQFEIFEPSQLSLTGTVTNVNCFAGNDGAIDVTVSGGVAPYTYSWQDAQGTTVAADANGDLSALVAGSYFVTVTDANNCTVNGQFGVSEPTQLTMDGVSTDVLCNGDMTGTIDVTVLGGTSPYTYTWNSLNTFVEDAITHDLSQLAAGDYYLTVTDEHSCATTAMYTITEPTLLEVTGMPVDATCSGFSNGSIDVTVQGGVSPYSYAWSNGSSDQDLTGVVADTYTVTVTDANGCEKIVGFVVGQPVTIGIIGTVTDVDCFGASNGAIDITVSGGMTPYMYSWSNQMSTEDISNLAFGTYSVTVFDANQCSVSEQFSVNQPTEIILSGVVTDVDCYGNMTGAIDLTVSGGSGTYLFDWSDNISFVSGLEDIDNLAAGTYFVTVQDANVLSCMQTAQFSVSQPDMLTLDGLSTDVDCNGNASGVIDITVAGGTTPYTYTWSGTGAFVEDTQTHDLSNVAAGTYDILVVDFNGCQVSGQFIITEPAVLEVTGLVVDVDCWGNFTGSIDITTTGGTSPYDFYWDNMSPIMDALDADLTGLAAGTYSLTVYDSNGCMTNGSWTVTEPNELTIPTANITSTNVTVFGANDGTASVTASGGTPPYFYEWSTGETTNAISGLAPGTYTVTATDSNGCMATASVTITEPQDLQITITGEIYCNGMSDGWVDVEINPSYPGTSPYTYIWNTGATTQDLANVPGGSYDITVTDLNGDQAFASITLVEPDALAVTLDAMNVDCNGANNGSIDALVSGGTAPYTYMWSNNETTSGISNLMPGNYCVSVYDTYNCMAVACVLITEPPALAINPDLVNPVCNGDMNGSITLNTTGGTPTLSFAWTGPNGFTSSDENIMNLGAGTYNVTVSDANGCQLMESFTLTEPTVLTADIYGFMDVQCYNAADGYVEVMAMGGTTAYTYLWSNGGTDAMISGLGPDTYTVTITDAVGCTATASQVITQPDELIVTLVETNVDCNGAANGSIMSSVTGGTAPFVYSWSNGEQTDAIYNLVPDTYCLTVTDAHQCSFVVCVDITEPPALAINPDLVNPVCNGDMNGSITLNTTGGTPTLSFAWTGPNGFTSGDENIMNLGAGMYSVTVSDANGCQLMESFTLTEPTVLTADIYGFMDVQCYNAADGYVEVLAMGGTTAYTYLWSNGGTDAMISGLGPDTYTVTVTDAVGCTATASQVITQPDDLLAGVTVTNIVCSGDNNGTVTASATGGTAAYTYSWTGPNGWTATGAFHDNLPAGDYCVTVTDMHQCTAVACATITEASALVIDLNVSDLLCLNGNQGAIDMTVTGGQPPYTIAWSNGETTEDLDSLVGDTYCVTVTDDYGCIAIACGTVNQPQYPLEALYITGENVSCYGFNDGWFEVLATGGAAPYQYSLDYMPYTSFMTTPMVYNNLAPGFHLLTIGDSNNCEVLYEVEITEPDPLAITFDLTHNLCYGDAIGAVDLTISGGTFIQVLPSGSVDTVGYTIVWSNGATTEDLSGLAAGTYSVTVTDLNACEITGSVVITEPPALVISTTHGDLNCYGEMAGWVDLTVAGGTAPYTYMWSNGAMTEDLINLSGGWYTVTVTDANGCQAMTTVAVTEPSPFDLNFTTTDIMCTGTSTGAIDLLLQADACLMYEWSNGATTQDITSLVAGWYWVTVTDCNGCVAIDSACIYAPNNPLSIDYTVNNVLCTGGSTGSIEINAVGGTIPYWGIIWTGVVPTECCGMDTIVQDSVQTWSLGQTSDMLSNLQAGTYYVTLIDVYGCEATAEIVVSEPPCPLEISNFTVTDIDLGVPGGVDVYICCGTFPYTYYWEYNGQFYTTDEDLVDVPAGSYSLTVTDANGCQVSGSFVVSTNQFPTWHVEIGESSHTIYVPASAVPMLSVGDYIGVFYDSLGTLACGGLVKWEGTSTTIAAWGDDGLDPSNETGFVDDELFTWIIWDVATGSEYAASASYNLAFPNDSTYVVNGISGLNTLTPGSFVDTHTLFLHMGWNLISTYINPFNPDVANVFSPVLSNLIIVKDGNGNVYWPSYSVNVIGNMLIGDGYKVKMLADAYLDVNGVQVVPESTPVYVPAEWSILGYLRTSPAPIDVLLSTIVADIELVKNEEGYVYWPGMFNLNTIGNMIPGKGYHIKMTTGQMFYYPANGLITGGTKSSILAPKHYNSKVNTGSDMTLGIPANAWTIKPEVGDEIAVLNSNHELVGNGVYNGSVLSISIWGDDNLTESVEGMQEGEQFLIELWHQSTGETEILTVSEWKQGSDVYKTNGISIVNKFEAFTAQGYDFALEQNMPNPFAETTVITFAIPAKTRVQLGIYNVLGELVVELVNQEMESGAHQVEFNARNLPSGTYMYKLNTDDYSATKQMNVIR